MMGHFRKKRFFPGNVPDIFRPLRVALCFGVLLPALVFLSGTATGAMDLSDEPMLAQIKPAPANIMIVTQGRQQTVI